MSIVLLTGCASTLKKAERYDFANEFNRNLTRSFEDAYVQFSKTENGQEVFDVQVNRYVQRRGRLIVWAITTLAAVLAAIGTGIGWLKAHVQLKKNEHAKAAE